ncbi:MAG: putative toxin [bacterium]
MASPSTSSAPAGGTGTAVYALTNSTTGTISVTTTLTGCSGPAITGCTIAPFNPPGPNGSVNIVVTYHAGSATATQPLTLTVQAGSLSAQATVMVTVIGPTYAIILTPNPATSTVSQGNSGIANYAIANRSTNTTTPITVTFSLTGCNGAITTCPVPANVVLAQGDSQNVAVGYIGITPGTATLSLTASSSVTAPTTKAVTVTVTSGSGSTTAISLTPSPTTSATVQGTPGIANFIIANQSSSTTPSLTITFSVTGCPAAIFPCTTPSPVTLMSGASQGVSVPYTGGVIGSNIPLVLTATTSGVTPQTATVMVTVNARAPGLALFAASEFPNGVITREACLSISAGDNAAYECGALRVVHPLPLTIAFGKARTPTLLYSSSHAAPGLILASNVTFTGPTQPTSILVTAKLGGRQVQRTFSWNSSWSDGLPRRIAIPIDAAALTLTDGSNPVLLPDTLEFKAMQGTTTLDTKVITGTVAIVDRRDSPFGNGWWLDGLERFWTPSGNATQKLWVGGDGSTRVYTQQGSSNIWLMTPALTRPDTLEYLPGSLLWHRHLPNGAYVEFDNAGMHVKTSDMFGRITSFVYTTNSGRLVLDNVAVLVPGGVAPTYLFHYSPDANQLPRLSSVVTQTASVTRNVIVTASSGWVSDIQDPIGLVSFGYNASHQLIRRVNKLRDTTTFAYDSASLLRSASLDMRRTNGPSAPPIAQSFCAAEGRSFTSCGGGGGNVPILPRMAYTLLDGPRIDVLDTTIFFINQFGAPDTIVNALGHRTRLTRDLGFPLLVQSVTAQSGLTTSSLFNVRGLPLSTTVSNPHGTGDAITSYQWDNELDLPIYIKSPSGVVSTRQYDRAARTMTWAETGGDRTQFTYIGGLVNTATRVTNGATESFGYDGQGNLSRRSMPLSGTTTIQHDVVGRDSVAIAPVVGSTILKTVMLYDIGGRATTQQTFGGSNTLTIVNDYDGESNLLSVTQSGSSDPNSIGPVSHTFTYDAAGRQVGDSLSGSDGPVRNIFDEAGNLKSGGRTGWGKTTSYDILNRPLQTFSGYASSVFTYDANGQLQTANNPFAQVSRGYDVSGALIADTLRIATMAAQPNTSNDFSQHQYVFRYTYDPSGRRTTMTDPSVLGGGTTTYTYDDPQTGALASIVDPAGIKYRYHYDPMGRLDSLVRRSTLADSGVESSTFDIESRVATRRGVIGPDVMYNDAFTYDKKGRVIHATGTDSIEYDPFGHVLYSRVSSIVERSDIDLLGNRFTSSNVLPHGGGGNDTYGYQRGTGRQLFHNRSAAGSGDTTFYRYDFLGNTSDESHVLWSILVGPNTYVYHNVDFSIGYTFSAYPFDGQNYPLNPGTPRRQINSTHNLYDEDNRLINSAYHVDSVYGSPTNPPNLPVTYDASESYRYDALGRRIWVRTTRGPVCTYAQPSTHCLNSVTRVLWDGDQIAGEIRATDTTTVALNGDTDSGSGLFAGVVRYTHGGGIDHPLAVTKLGGFMVYPFTHWRGAISFGGCKVSSAAVSRCPTTTVLFPLRAAGIFGAAHSTTSLGTPNWYGSVIEGMRDGSGKVFQRNRYLDPESGRFTQEDPIGLAGGLNAYGFGGGDPVNFSDPFGLCPPEDNKACPWMHEEGLQSGGWADPLLWLSGGVARGLVRAGADAAIGETGTALARRLGAAGEEAAGLVKNTIRIPSATGSAAYRIPDGLSGSTLSEVKNVGKLNLTNQLKDFAAYAQQTGRAFELYVRGSTTLSGPLQQFIQDNNILLRILK